MQTLKWPGDSLTCTVLPECFGILKDLGVEEKLRVMENDPERDVRDRARTALSQLTSLSDMQEE
jgi:hypothetical protein